MTIVTPSGCPEDDGRRDGLSEQVVQPDGTMMQRTVAYAFDLANRLTGESGQDGAGRSYSKSYSLDSAGNRLASSFTLDGQLQSQATYSYNSLDWLTNTSVQSQSGTNSTSYGYDANGAQISQTSASGTSASLWDFEGNLRAQGAVDASGNWNGPRNTYNYDASGMRLTQAAFNAAGTLTSGTSYVWNGDRVAEERDASGVLQKVYEHGQELGPLRLRRLKDGAWQNRFFVGDGQDSTRQLMNEAGVVTDSYFYDSFGNALNGGQGVTNNAFKYTGQQQDSNGLYYLRARYYNSGTGRFLSHDPEMGSADDPVSMHRYLYAGADAVNNVDPSGREFSIAGMMTAMCWTMKVYDAVGAVVNIGEAGMEFAKASRDVEANNYSSAANHAILGAVHFANAAFCAIALQMPIPDFGGGGMIGPAAELAVSRLSLREATAFASAAGAHVLSAGISGISAQQLEADLLMMTDKPEDFSGVLQGAREEAGRIVAEGRKGTGAALDIDGEIFTGRSTGAGGKPLEELDQGLQNEVNLAEQSLRRNGRDVPDTSGNCSEIRAYAAAKAAGKNLKGGKMVVSRADTGGNLGKVMEPCNTCRELAEEFGVTQLGGE